MADNLTISIGADSSKLRADLELAKGKLQELGREMRAARAEALKSGDRTNLDRLAKEYDAVARSARGLQTQLRATNKEIASPAWSTATKAAAALNAEFLALAKSGLGFAAGLGGALLSAANLINKTKDQLLELRRLSQSTGFSPGAIKAVNEALEDTGLEAGAGNRGLQKLALAFAEVRQEAKNAGSEIKGAVEIFRGSDIKDKPQDPFGIEIFRGGQRTKTEIKTVADALRSLRVDLRKFKDDAAGNDAALQAIIDGFARLAKEGKIDEANLDAQILFSRNMREMLPALKALAAEAGGLQAKMDELRQQKRFPGDEEQAQALAYQKALKDLGDEYDKLGFAALRAFGPFLQEQMKLVVVDIQSIVTEATKLKDLWTLLTATMLTDVQNLMPQIVQAFSDMFARLISGFRQLGDAVTEWARTIAAAVRSVLPGGSLSGPASSAPIEIPPMAGGGIVRGPGSGTSDSILARLSNGEFVMRARAVDHWGPRFLAALNSLQNPFGYAGGGLVRAPRFATGGLVQARTSDGVTVNLMFPGGTFALRADREIVGGLTREARRAGMLSAGRMAAAIA